MKKILIKVLIVFISVMFIMSMTIAATANNDRQTTGEGKTLSFEKGDNVCGAVIKINGKTFLNSYLQNAPMNGKITSGVINFWQGEIKGLTFVSNTEILKKVIAETRQATGVGKTLSFKKGDYVCGAVIKINGKTFLNSYINNAPMDGQVTSGVIKYWKGENKGLIFVSNKEVLEENDEKVRTPTGVGKTLSFEVGDTIIGWKITINGKTVEGDNILYDSPVSGFITDGVVNPWPSEITNQKVITISDFIS